LSSSEAKLRSWMRMAVDLGKQSVAENEPKPHVGAVVVQNDEVIGSGCRGHAGEGNHAEYGVLMELADMNLSGAQVFTTLEPRSNRKHPRFRARAVSQTRA
jgi:diaminohydroxyphosphoribosylaminopyrimidine deaminase / 5-amino-6-(5-phosphoribosylamino)uracil reductase